MEGVGRLAHSVPARLSGSYTAADGRKFGLTVGVALTVLSVIAAWRGHPISTRVLGSAGVLLLLAAILAPRSLGPVERAWMGLASAISRVTTPVFMGIVYFVILTPIALLRRAVAGSALRHKPGAHGFWLDRSGEARSALDRQF